MLNAKGLVKLKTLWKGGNWELFDFLKLFLIFGLGTREVWVVLTPTHPLTGDCVNDLLHYSATLFLERDLLAAGWAAKPSSLGGCINCPLGGAVWGAQWELSNRNYFLSLWVDQFPKSSP